MLGAVLFVGAGCSGEQAAVTDEGDIANSVFTLALDAGVHIDSSRELGGRYELLETPKTEQTPKMGNDEYFVEYAIGESTLTALEFNDSYPETESVVIDGKTLARGELVKKGGEMATYVVGYYYGGGADEPAVLFRISADTKSGLKAGEQTVKNVDWQE